jgi:hypothetical protein
MSKNKNRSVAEYDYDEDEGNVKVKKKERRRPVRDWKRQWNNHGHDYENTDDFYKE